MFLKDSLRILNKGSDLLYIGILYIYMYIYICISGQIIATSHDPTPNGGLVREIPVFQGNLAW